MRLKRRLAFVLALSLLLGNVTPAFAQEATGGTSISGDVTITSDGNGNPVIINNSDVIENEDPEIDDETDLEGDSSNDDGTETGGELDDDQLPDNGDSLPGDDNGEGENGDGSETGDGTETGSGEEGTLPGDDVLEGEEVETESSVPGVEIIDGDSLSGNGVNDKSEIPVAQNTPDGTEEKYVFVFWNASEFEYFSTIADAVKKVESLYDGNAITSGTPIISLPADGEQGADKVFQVSGKDLVINDLYSVTLDLKGRDLIVVKGDQENAVVESNINLSNGNIVFSESGITFKILERVGATDTKNNDININGINFTNSEGSTDNILIIGDNQSDTTSANIDAFVDFYNVSVSAFSEIKIYDSFMCGGTNSFNADKIDIELDMISNSEREYVSFKDTVVIKELYLKGDGNANFGIQTVYNPTTCDLTITDKFEVEKGYSVNFNGKASIANLTVTGDKVGDLQLYVGGTWKTGSQGEFILDTVSTLEFVNSVTNNGSPIYIYLMSQQPLDDGYVTITTWPKDTTVATIDDEGQGTILPGMFTVADASLIRDGNNLVTSEPVELFKLWYLEPKPGTQYDYMQYEVGDYTSAKDVVAAMEENPGRQYVINLIKSHTTGQVEEWDFTSKTYNLNVRLELYHWYDGLQTHTVTIPEDGKLTIKADTIYGEMPGVFELEENATLQLAGGKVAAGSDETYLFMSGISVQAAEDANQINLIIGEEGKVNQGCQIGSGCSFSTFDYDEYKGISNLNLTLNGNVFWNTGWRANAVAMNKAIEKKYGYGELGDYYQDPNYDDKVYGIDDYEVIYLKSLTINSPEGYVEIGDAINAEKLDLNGNCNFVSDRLKASKVDIDGGSFLGSYYLLELQDIEIHENGTNKDIYIGENILYFNNENYANDRPEICLKGSLTCSDESKIYVSRTATMYIANSEGWITSRKNYPTGEKLYNNEPLLYLDLEEIEGNALLDSTHYAAGGNNTNLSMQVRKFESYYGNYELVVVDNKKPVRVESSNGGYGTGDDLYDARDFIEEDVLAYGPGAEYEIIMNASVKTVSANDLDYSDIEAGNVKLDLNGYTLNMNTSQQTIAVDIIEGKNEKGDKKGTINMTQNITMKPRTIRVDDKGESSLSCNDVTLKSNSTNLTLGNKDNTYNPKYKVYLNDTVFSGTPNELNINTNLDTKYIDINAKNIQLLNGTWDSRNITATNLLVNGYNDGEQLVKTQLNTSKITMNSGGTLDVKGNISAYNAKKYPEVILNGAKLHVESFEDTTETPRVFLESLTVNSAFGGESMADYTVENNGQLYVENMNMKAGTLYNTGNLAVKTITSIKDIQNSGSWICDSINQVSSGKTWLSSASAMLINTKGTLYNINVGDKSGNGGNALMVIGKKNDNDAEISINGTFTTNKEEQKLEIASDYKEITLTEAGVPAYSYDAKKVNVFGRNDVLFTTNHKAFPVEYITVLPTEYADKGGTVTNQNTVAVRDGNKVLVSGNLIHLYSVQQDGYEFLMKDFTNWKDAIDYLTAVGNTGTKYVLELVDDVEVGGAIKLPANVAGLEIRGKEVVEWLEGEIEVRHNAQLNFTGDLTMATEMAFNKVTLPKTASIKTGGKALTLKDVDGKIQTIVGTTATNLTMEDCQLELTKAAAVTVGQMEVIKSTLKTGQNLTITTLIMENGTNDSMLDANGKITITNMITYGEGSSLSYNSLEIKGTLSSFTEDGETAENGERYAVINSETGFCEIKDEAPAGKDGKAPVLGVDYAKVKKNAIYLTYKTAGEMDERTTLATAPKIASSWFISREIEEDKTAATGYKANLKPTRKEATLIKYGMKGAISEDIVLKISGQDYAIGNYTKLQDAFDEIERLGDATQSYEVIIKADAKVQDAKGNAADAKFPAKAEKVYIKGIAGDTRINIIFKSKADIKCDVVFENVELLTAKDVAGTLAINGFEVELKEAGVSHKIAVTGSGIGKGSRLVITGNEADDFVETKEGEDIITEYVEDDLVTVAAITNVDMVATNTSDLHVLGNTSMGTLELEDNTTFCGVGTIQVKDVACKGYATMVTFPATNELEDDENETDVVTSFTTKLTISGILDTSYGEDDQGFLFIELGTNPDDEEEGGKEILTWDIIDDDRYTFSDDLMDGNKVVLAKAPNVSTCDIDWHGDGALYKKSGNLVYKHGEDRVLLRYLSDDENEYGPEFTTYCESFAEAVAEINNLKVKRDYEISFLDKYSDYYGDDYTKPETLTMPDKRYANSLTLTSQDEGTEQRFVVPYMGDITFTTPVVLDNIVFEQKAASKDEDNKTIYLDVVDIKKGYPAPANVKAVDNAVTLSGYVSFDTPILLSGSKKAELIIDESAYVEANVGVYLTEEVEVEEPDNGEASGSGEGEGQNSETGEETYIWEDIYLSGKVTGFGKVTIPDSMVVTIDGWYTAEDVYSACELSTENLVVNDWALVTVGSEGIANKTKATEILLKDGAELYSYGSGEFKNVTMAGDCPVLAAYGQKFTITGVLTSTACGAELVTGLTAKKESALNVSGTAVLEDMEENRITVTVMEDEYTAFYPGDHAYEIVEKVVEKEVNGEIIEEIEYETKYLYDSKNNPIYNSSHLLTASKVDEKVFLVSTECLMSEKVDDFDGTGEFNIETAGSKGYFLKKNGNYVDVHYSDEIQVALGTTEKTNVEDGGENYQESFNVINYYKTVDEAVAAIKKFNDTTKEYEIVLLDSIGSVDEKDVITYYKLPIPEKAKKVTFRANGGKDGAQVLYNSNNFTQKTNIAFEDITVINNGTWDTKTFTLEVDKADVTMNKKATLTNLTLTDAAMLTAEDVATITNINNEFTSEYENGDNVIKVNPGKLTIKGEVTDSADASLNEEFTQQVDGKNIVVIPSVVIAVEDAAVLAPNKDKENNNIEGQYTLSNASKMVTLEKEDMETFDFRSGKDGDYVWASKGIYLVDGNFAYDVEVTRTNAEDVSNTQCLDMAEATNYINTVKDRTSQYDIVVNGDIADTKVTDKVTASTLVLPNKDTAKTVEIVGKDTNNTENGIQRPAITFTNDSKLKGFKVSGSVTFKDVELVNADKKTATEIGVATAITMERNSDIKNGKVIVETGESKLVLENTNITHNVSNITGVKGYSTLEVKNGQLNATGSVSNLKDFNLVNSRATSVGAATVTNLTLDGYSNWSAHGATQIENVNLNNVPAPGDDGMPAMYIATKYSGKGLPQLTITGKVTGGNLPISISDYDADERMTAGERLAAYDGAKLLMAKAESADKFIAYPYAEYKNRSYDRVQGYESNGETKEIKAFKDQSGYVSNGTISNKQVILRQGDMESYVSNYVEAINIINNFGNKEQDYEIELLKIEEKNGDQTTYTDIHKTAVDKTGKVIRGAFTLPKAGKAKSLTINGNGNTIEYTGAIAANCNLVFKNVVLNEKNKEKDVTQITLKAGTYDVDMSNENVTVKGSGDNNLHFKTIDSAKGGLEVGDRTVFVSGETKLDRLYVTGNTTVTGENKVTINNVVYEEVNEGTPYLYLTGKKAIAITNIKEEGNVTGSCLDITTYNTSKVFQSSAFQLSINGEVDKDVTINVKPMIYDRWDGVHAAITEDYMEDLLISSTTKAKAFQKVITAPKMVAHNNINLMYYETNYDTLYPYETGYDTPYEGEWKNDNTVHAVKQDGSLYFTRENMSVEVTGCDEKGNEAYTGTFFAWEQAVKEIDKLNHTKWTYTITLTGDQGATTPLKSVTMPVKAAHVLVKAETDDIGMITTGAKISMKTPTEFENISLCAVKKSGSNYYSTPLTLDCANTTVVLDDVKQNCHYDGIGRYTTQMVLSGAAKATATVESPGQKELITQITNVGNVILTATDENVVYYNIVNGIKGVKVLTLEPNAKVDTGKSEVNVADLIIGDVSNTLIKEATLNAKNITVTGTATLTNANLSAGTTTVGDGKITLNNVMFKNNNNTLSAKQDKNGKSLINIKGTVDATDNLLGASAATITLYLNNSTQKKAQVVDGMVMLTAPKAATNLFDVDGGMQTDVKYGLYKSGNDMKYGRKDANEVALWIGTDTAEGAYRKSVFRTFEEAVKAIDSMALYQNPNDKVKVFEKYTIELLHNVEIGNDSKNGKYSALALPSKTSGVSIVGNDPVTGEGTTEEIRNVIRFSGNVTLKANTTLQNVTLLAMKLNKTRVTETTANMAVGNYALTIKENVFGNWNNVTGSAKGSLILKENSNFSANNITGINVVFEGMSNDYYRATDTNLPVASILTVNGNLTAKEIRYRDYAYGILKPNGKTVIDAVYVEGANKPVVEVTEGNVIQIKGVTRTLADKTKVTGSVFFDDAEKLGAIDKIDFRILSKTDKDVPAGTKVITGKYLSPSHWNVKSFLDSEDEPGQSRVLYLNGADLYLGGNAS